MCNVSAHPRLADIVTMCKRLRVISAVYPLLIYGPLLRGKVFGKRGKLLCHLRGSRFRLLYNLALSTLDTAIHPQCFQHGHIHYCAASLPAPYTLPQEVSILLAPQLQEPQIDILPEVIP